MIGDNKLFDGLIGDWAGEERLFPSAWTAPGVARARASFRHGPGSTLLHDYDEQRDGAVAVVAHAVLGTAGFWWFDSLGFVPAEPGTLTVEGDTLVLERSSPQGRSRHAWTPCGDCLEHRIATAPPEQELQPLLAATYLRL